VQRHKDKDANDESDQPEMRMNDAFGVENARNNPPGSPQQCMSRSKDIEGAKESVVVEEKSTSRSEASTSVDQNNQNPASPRWNASTSLGAMGKSGVSLGVLLLLGHVL